MFSTVFRFFNLPAFSTKVCSWTQLKNCMPHFSPIEALANMKNCSISCEYFLYTLSNTTVQQMSFAYEICEAKYIIVMNSLQYPMYTEISALGFYNLVATLGGILGIWLGIDIMMFSEWLFVMKRSILTLIDIFKLWRRRRVVLPRGRQRDVAEQIMELESI